MNTISKTLQLHELLEEMASSLNYIEGLHHHSTLVHECSVSKYMYHFAKSLNMNEEESARISFVGKFHDIGKVKLSPSLLDKPTPLTSPQRKEIEQHSEIGTA